MFLSNQRNTLNSQYCFRTWLLKKSDKVCILIINKAVHILKKKKRLIFFVLALAIYLNKENKFPKDTLKEIQSQNIMCKNKCIFRQQEHRNMFE